MARGGAVWCGMTRPDSTIAHGTLVPNRTPGASPGHAITWRCDFCRQQSGVMAGRVRVGPLWACAGCGARRATGVRC